jgi:hypothetical protein
VANGDKSEADSEDELKQKRRASKVPLNRRQLIKRHLNSDGRRDKRQSCSGVSGVITRERERDEMR